MRRQPLDPVGTERAVRTWRERPRSREVARALAEGRITVCT
jgi:hypothetical protein